MIPRINPLPLRRVLVVEDDPGIRDIIRLALETLGDLLVHTCDGGETALAAIDGFAPQLLLCDLMMPGMDGLQLLGALRSRYRQAAPPMVFLTARSDPRTLAVLGDELILGVIAKPFDPRSLPLRLQHYWVEWTARQGALGPI